MTNNGNGITIRVEKTKDFITMSNEHLKNPRLSLRAKGLLSVLLALPDSWEYSIQGLASICLESYKTIKKILAELKVEGYLEIIKYPPSKENGGRFSYKYVIHERSQIK